MRPDRAGVRFSPGVYEHAAALIGCGPQEVSRDADLLARAHAAAWERYRHPMVVAGIDVYNVEPEALGATVVAADPCAVPCVEGLVADSLDALLRLRAPDPSRDGRMPLVLEAARRLVRTCRGSVVYVPVCGPLAFANGLAGMDEVLCGIVESPQAALAALEHLADLQRPFLEAIVAAGARPLVFESGACPPLLPPRCFEELECAVLGRLFSHCRAAAGQAPACILGGDAAPIASALLGLRPGFVICPAETDQMAFAAAARAFPKTEVRVNMPVAPVAAGDRAGALEAAARALDVAGELPRASVGTGVVPYGADPELIAALRDFVEAAPAHAFATPS